MQYTKLGNSDLTVSRICMGCMGFGIRTAVSTAGHWTRKIPARSYAGGWNLASISSILP